MKFSFATFVPVVNARQQLVALWMKSDACSSSERLRLLAEVRARHQHDDVLQDVPVILSLPAAECPPPEALDVREQTHTIFLLPATDPVHSLEALRACRAQGVSCLFGYENDLAPGVPHEHCVIDARAWPALRLPGKAPHWVHRIADTAQLKEARQWGVKWYAGDYPYRPSSGAQPGDASARARLLKLLNLVTQDAETVEIERLFKQDSSLAFMLFKLVSSAAFGQSVKVNSFTQALNLLGRRQLQRWLQLLLYAQQSNTSEGLHPLLLRAAFRAAFMEGLARRSGQARHELDGAFMVGMFSLLDLLFSSPLEQILSTLSLDDTILKALLEHQGVWGCWLELANLADREESPVAAQKAWCLDHALDPQHYLDAQLDAYAWVAAISREF